MHFGYFCLIIRIFDFCNLRNFFHYNLRFTKIKVTIYDFYILQKGKIIYGTTLAQPK